MNASFGGELLNRFVETLGSLKMGLWRDLVPLEMAFGETCFLWRWLPKELLRAQKYSKCQDASSKGELDLFVRCYGCLPWVLYLICGEPH